MPMAKLKVVGKMPEERENIKQITALETKFEYISKDIVEIKADNKDTKKTIHEIQTIVHDIQIKLPNLNNSNNNTNNLNGNKAPDWVIPLLTFTVLWAAINKPELASDIIKLLSGWSR